MNAARKNEIKFYIAESVMQCAVLLISGSILQSFLMESGVGERSVTMYVSVMQVLQMVAMVAFSGVIENLKNVIKTTALLYLGFIPVLVVLSYFCTFGRGASGALLPAIFITGGFVSIFQGIRGIIGYKLAYRIMDIARYGRICGFSGVFIGISCALFSAIISYFSENADYFSAMNVFFLIGIGMLITAFTATYLLRDLGNIQMVRKEKINIFRYKPFYFLLIPNLLRGFHTGVWGVLTVIGYSAGILDKSSAATFAVILQVAAMAGCFVYALIAQKINDGKLILLSSIAVAVLTPFMFVGNSRLVFFAVFFVANIAFNFIAYGVPTAVTKIVHYNCIGQYSAWRMVIHTLGVAVGGAAVTYAMELFGIYITLIIAGACQVVSGAAYYIAMKDRGNWLISSSAPDKKENICCRPK